jgi:hypothetical protein
MGEFHMKKTVISIIFVLLLSIGGFGSDMNASTLDRSTWLWNPWEIVSDETGTLSFLEQKQVNKVYVQIDRDIPMNVYRSFITKASVKGIYVYALDGAPGWVAPKGYRNQDVLMNWLKTYQAGSTASQKFAGIHLDVEPYLYSGWNSNRATTVKSYQALLTMANTSAAALKLPLEADLPFWFDEVTYNNTYGKGNLAEWVITKTNSVTIMAYRDTADAIIDIVKNEVAFAGKHNKAVVIGVETGATDEGDVISFYEEGEAYMNNQLASVASHYSSVAGYKGMAIHHVGSWKTMTP